MWSKYMSICCFMYTLKRCDCCCWVQTFILSLQSDWSLARPHPVEEYLPLWPRSVGSMYTNPHPPYAAFHYKSWLSLWDLSAVCACMFLFPSSGCDVKVWWCFSYCWPTKRPKPTVNASKPDSSSSVPSCCHQMWINSLLKIVPNRCTFSLLFVWLKTAASSCFRKWLT